ncbi:ABC transporter substrate-binding protein [Fictibacillus phosphorivorans]|uniref:ABC transporter substrate-binding protein n=1 Tax=Fictibacillus phosphorivorans TaxID=1221500 RepID=UPI00203BAECF|nr:ABC transporter substrate-binding protein [Fictibacillus phosphorivorans]MCM3717773.1 ABC transporter substrate-binding protein [Fictibacillus phosphorivorans]MCM3777001.1 ABC transporter substrate-binding protein [Fictibacillus phosphorivorans]
MKAATKSIKLLLSLILSLTLLLTACSSNGGQGADSDKNSEGKVVIDFWTFWGSEIRRPVIEKIIQDFNNSQDKIEVKHTYLPFGDIWTKNLASIAAGKPADVIINDINQVAHRAQNNQNTNLSKYMEKDPEVKDRFFPELYKASLYKGEPYALPFNTDTRMLFYNKDMFKEVGLDPNKPPATWEELEEYGKKLDIKNGKNYDRIGYLPNYKMGAEVWMINADGKSYWDYKKEKPIIDDPSNIEALTWFKDYYDYYGSNVINKFQAEFGEETADPFISGKLAMTTETTNFFTKIRDYGEDINFGIAPLPAKEPGKSQTSWGGGFVAEIPKGAEHPDEAWEFLKYLTDVQAQEHWAVKGFDNVANIEASKKAAENPEFSEDGKMVYTASVKNLEETIITPVPLQAPDFTNLINPELEKVLLGKQSPKEGLKKAQRAVEQLVKNNK